MKEHEPSKRDHPMSDKPRARFTIVFEKLAELQDSAEGRESADLANEAEEIQELRSIIEDATAPEYIEYATT